LFYNLHMSRTKKGNARDPFDFYATPHWCVYRLLEEVNFPTAGYWLEPSAGNGAILYAMHKYSKDHPVFTAPDPEKTFAVEIQPDLEEALKAHTPNIHIGDFLQYDFSKHCKKQTKADVCIGNPPYKLALPIIQHAMKQAEVVCFLLRINFLASDARAEWMQENTPDVHVLPNRPKFKNGRSDACEYAWFVWGPNSTGKITILDKTPKSERKGV
jgi:hypothetical protein